MWDRLDRWRIGALARRLEGLVPGAGRLSPKVLRGLRTDVRALRQRVDGFLAAADRRLGPAVAPPLRTASGVRADRVWRPAFWSAPCPAGAAAASDGAQFDGELNLFHDCPLREWTARQVTGTTEGAAPFGLVVEVFEFTGSYMSLSLTLPDDLARATAAHHILAIEARAEAEGSVDMTARLNVLHGPDRAQATQAMQRAQGWSAAEFDLAHLDISDRRIERIWIDLFLGQPRMNRIVLSDLLVSWRRRAEV